MMLTATSCKKETAEIEQLSDAEITDLKFSIEEEKLARDVYLFSYEKYGEKIFNNISTSEQKHMTKIAGLLDYYSLENPTIGLGIGEFKNSDLQDLYEELILTVDSSYYHALIVGATIEDMDIYDLNSLKDHTLKTDLISAYDQLLCGSKNHIRAFCDALDKLNETYTPTYITLEELDEILNTNKDDCKN